MANPQMQLTAVLSDEQQSESNAENGIDLSREMREELMKPEVWSEVLGNYARTVGLAVALTDCAGHQLGLCYNPQPVWLMAHGGTPEGVTSNEPACSFCLDTQTPCEAVTTALTTGSIELVNDRAGLVHLAIPLSLGKHRLGGLIAGQVFDQYPEPLRLQRLARHLKLSPQEIWQRARLQPPVRSTTLHIYGELLLSLGNAFLRQRYAVILDRELERTNLRLRLSLDGIKDHALFTVSRTGLVTSWNLGSERMFGHTESDILGQDFSCLFTLEDIEAGAPGNLLRQASTDRWVNDQGWQVRKDGTRFFAESSLAGLGREFSEFGRLTHDVTEQRKSADALLQTQKLESIGVLASGIAHDFNNLLSGILGGVSFALSTLPLDHSAYPMLAIAEKSSEKAADLTHQLLAYAGQGKFVVTQFDLSVLIQDMLQLLQASIPKLVVLQVDMGSDLPWIEADASQIQQIVMNLVINGAESIGPAGGLLKVSTGATPRENPLEGQSAIEVWMEVQDSGSGMTEQTQARIFDPFFTTKFTGRGLGLAAVSGIVRGHEGRMQVESVLGRGTTFRILLPGVERRNKIKEPSAVLKDEYGSGTILIVDDEPLLVMLAKAILERSGYTVLTAGNGREAVETFRQHSATITAVLLDLTMPVMGGEEAFHLMRALRGELPVVISTGYSDVNARELFGSGAYIGFLQKPYTAAQLREKIRAISQVD